METLFHRLCTAFAGIRCIATGELAEVAIKVKNIIDKGETERILIFDDITSEQIEVDFQGTAEDITRKLNERFGKSIQAASPESTEKKEPAGPGRPKLGVVAREVTLLPRHWEWLNRQPGGASVALRKLVEEARHANESKDRLRLSKEAVYRFMYALAGDQPGYEEVSRALFNGSQNQFLKLVENWPQGIRDHIQKLAATAF